MFWGCCPGSLSQERWLPSMDPTTACYTDARCPLKSYTLATLASTQAYRHEAAWVIIVRRARHQDRSLFQRSWLLSHPLMKEAPLMTRVWVLQETPGLLKFTRVPQSSSGGIGHNSRASVTSWTQPRLRCPAIDFYDTRSTHRDRAGNTSFSASCGVSCLGVRCTTSGSNFRRTAIAGLVMAIQVAVGDKT